MNQLFGDRLAAMRSRFLTNDLEALQALTQDRESNADGLPSMTMPRLLFAGELDPRLARVKECASALPNPTFFILRECNHPWNTGPASASAGFLGQRRRSAHPIGEWLSPKSVAPHSAPVIVFETPKRSSAAQSKVMGVIERNNVHIGGSGERIMIFAHGFGCDQNMWRFVEPAFASHFKSVLFDHVGAGSSDLKAYDKKNIRRWEVMPTTSSKSDANLVWRMRYSWVTR